MLYSDFDKLKTFFLALNKSGFHPERMDPKIITPQDKIYCLNLLREKIPELKGKTDNELFEFLRDPNKVKKQILGRFVAQEEIELEKILEEKPVATEVVAEQPTGQSQEVPPPTESSMPGGLPSMPSVGISPSYRPRPTVIIQNIPQAPAPPPQPRIVPATSSGMIKEAGKPAELVKASRLGEVEEPSFFKQEPVIANKSGVVTQAGEPSKLVTATSSGAIKEPRPKQIRVRNIQPPSWLKTFGSNAQIFAKKNLGRVFNGLKNMGGGILGGLAGVGRSGLGAAAPTLGRLGNSVLGGIQTISRPGGIGGLGGGVTKGLKSPNKAIFIGLGVFLLVILLMGVTGALTGTPQTGEASPIGGATNISSCKFTREGVAFSITSNTLKQFFQEVADKTGVPSAVLAGVAAHENATFTFAALDTHDAFYSRGFSGIDCEPHFKTSPTGALGLMQIQTPPNLQPQKASEYNPTAVSLEGIKIGLGFLNRDLSSLTTADFCDVRTNIYFAAGILISKNGGKPPTTPDEIKSAVCSYYGQCTYGSYNYGEEVKQDFENCKAAFAPALASTCPIPGSKMTCGPSKPTLTYYSTSCQGGHCAGNYGFPAYCSTYPSTVFGVDIAGAVGQEVLMPSITYPGTNEIHQLVCEYVGSMQGTQVWQIITQFKCTDDTNKSVWIQFHHLQNNYNIPVGIRVSTGNSVGLIAEDPGGPHVHVQIGIDGTCGNSISGCVAADQYLKCSIGL